MRSWVLILLFTLVFASTSRSQGIRPGEDSLVFATDTSYQADSLASDSFFSRHFSAKRFGLLDTISNDTILRNVLASYHAVRNFYTGKVEPRLKLPTVKEIENRPVRRAQWKFWIICFVLIYISFVRIANQNNFRVFLLSVFNMKLSEKIWEDQRSVFSFVILQLFAIYLFIAALFINYFMEMNGMNPFGDYFIQYLAIVSVLIVIYLVKFLIHWLLGVLLKMNKLGSGFVANTVSVNNFIALVIFPFIIFIIYNENQLLTHVLIQTVVAIFFVSVFYRLIRITLLRHTFFSFPNLYLFIYLCTLEIIPWLVIIKFINQYQI